MIDIRVGLIGLTGAIGWIGLTVYDNRHIKMKIRIYGNKVYTHFRGLCISEDDIECKSFTVNSFDSLVVSGNKYYLQYLDHCTYRTANK